MSDIGSWFEFLVNTWMLIFTEIYDQMVLQIDGITFSIGGFIVAGLIIGFVITVFWKGAQS